MPSNKVIAAFYMASGIILYVAYATLVPARGFDPDLPNPMHYAKRTTK